MMIQSVGPHHIWPPISKFLWQNQPAVVVEEFKPARTSGEPLASTQHDEMAGSPLLINIWLRFFLLLSRTFSRSCNEAQEKLTQQIRNWSNGGTCKESYCNYEFLGTDRNIIRGSHTTPTLKFVDNFSFTFTSNTNGCSVKASSLPLELAICSSDFLSSVSYEIYCFILRTVFYFKNTIIMYFWF